MGPAVWTALAWVLSVLPHKFLTGSQWRPSPWEASRRKATVSLSWDTWVQILIPLYGGSRASNCSQLQFLEKRTKKRKVSLCGKGGGQYPSGPWQALETVFLNLSMSDIWASQFFMEQPVPHMVPPVLTTQTISRRCHFSLGVGGNHFLAEHPRYIPLPTLLALRRLWFNLWERTYRKRHQAACPSS